jgi:hypothetical protein
MGISDKHILIAKKVLTYLSWDRIVKISILSLIAIVLVMAWLSRGMVFHTNPPKLITVSILDISPAIAVEINDVVKRNDHIIGIQVVTVNFQKNTRTETFASIDNPSVQQIYDRFISNKVVETALFDENRSNNSRIIRLISGEFVCVPYKDSTAYKFAPDAGMFISDVCAIGIPPSYGEFTGILTIYLKDKPTKEFIEQLFLLSRALSLKIYDENKAINEGNK